MKPRLLTGDTPTGKLHLGHWVGSLENRVSLQSQYECYFLIANTHAFTTRVDQPGVIYESVLDITLDYLSVGIDPVKSAIFVESDIPAIFELATLLAMLIPVPRLMRNPTIKDEIRDKNLGNHYSMGFLWYPILQVADILAFQADLVPVGVDQVPHLELTREIVRRFHETYGQENTFVMPECLLGRVHRLPGLGAPNSQGQLLKMSKSLNNAIFLSDDSETVQKKIMGMYTDPARLKATDPGTVEGNPLWIFHDIFNTDQVWIAETKKQYQAGTIGDVACKKRLIEAVNALLTPMRERRQQYAKEPGLVLALLAQGAQRANAVAQDTLSKVKTALKQVF